MLPVLSFAIIGVAIAIVAEGGLAFLGLSVQPPTARWGGMINEGRTVLEHRPADRADPLLRDVPDRALLNFAGDRFREYFDVKEGGL